MKPAARTQRAKRATSGLMPGISADGETHAALVRRRWEAIQKALGPRHRIVQELTRLTQPQAGKPYQIQLSRTKGRRFNLVGE